MKKNFKYFALIWFASLVIFNAVTFLVPAEIAGIKRFDQPAFWIAYAFITVALIGQLVSALVVCVKSNLEKVFLNIPLLKLGYSALAVSVVVGLVFMVVPVIAPWIGALVCIIIMALYIIACVKATAAANIVSEKTESIKAQTSFIKTAVVDAENIMARATTTEIKTETKKVYEALRYSDYVSTPELIKIEVHIEDHLKQLKVAVESEDLEMVQTEANELLLLIKERNSKCKATK